MNFYNYFLTLCNEKGVKPSRAGLDIGISKTAVNGWKRGGLPTDSTLMLLANYFGIAIEDFWQCDDLAKDRGIENDHHTEDDEMVEALQQLRDSPATRSIMRSAKSLTESQLQAIEALMRQMRGE